MATQYQPTNPQEPVGWHLDQARRCKALDAQYSPAPGSAYRRALVTWHNSHTALVERHCTVADIR